MGRGALAGVMLAVAVAVPQAAISQPLCVQDLDARALKGSTEVRLGLPDWPSRGHRRKRAQHPPTGANAVERTAGAVSMGGRNPAVHGGYDGCGEQVELNQSTGRGRLSYARSQDWDPWRRLDGDPFAAEHFFDAAIEAPAGGPVEAGYALNLYATEGQPASYGSGRTARNVTGSSFWLSGFDDRVRLKSSLAVDQPTADGAAPLAHHHELEVAPVRFGEAGSVFASLSYAQADEGFAAGRGAYLPADGQSWSVGAGLRSAVIGMRLDYRRGRDNLDDYDWQATRSYDEWVGRVDLDAPVGGLFVPDLISFRGSVRRDVEAYKDDLSVDQQQHASAGWGVNMLWRDDKTSAGIDVSGRMADSSALESAGVLPSHRLGLTLGADAGEVRLSGRLYSERQSIAAGLDEDLAMDYGGSLAAGLFGQRLEGSVAYGRTAYYPTAPTLRWGMAAEVDAVELLGTESLGGWGEDVFALGRLESHFAEDATGWQAEYTAKLVAGFRF